MREHSGRDDATRRHPPVDLLSAFADDELDSALRARVERHLSRCPECRATHDSLVSTKAGLAALPREIAAPADLWSGIRAAIGESEPTVSPAASVDEPLHLEPPVTRRAPPFRRAPVTLAAAAVVLVLLGGTVIARLISAPYTTDAASSDPEAAHRFASLEAPYVAATAELAATLERRRAALPPDVVEPFAAALAIVDEAVRETRAAVAADPANDELTEMALAAQRRKLELLQRVAQWSTEE